MVKNKKQADAILAALDGKPYTVTRVDKGQRRRQGQSGNAPPKTYFFFFEVFHDVFSFC